ncbi:unnamed protein product [Ceutorhynchus assimilis]|uniref:non-specific serine/threonine protein kinase n=1 Tax=Ceutorhynchus assimilis TaxID=467358 RepID=A0A9P0DCQ2_9CUCU|nr:unnamed protein product [Ceutorhynchus assimilis]
MNQINAILENRIRKNALFCLAPCFCTLGLTLGPSLWLNKRTKKNGHYEEPAFISKESKKLIRSMLQIEPSKRIKISQLLNHPWLTLGIFDPVNYKTKTKKDLDRTCVQTMSKFMNIDENSLKLELSEWLWDYNTVTYLLLLNRKTRGQSLRLYPAAYGWKFPVLVELTANHSTPNNKQTRTRRKFVRSPGYLSPTGQFLEPDRKALKRPRSPALLDEASPVPSKKLTPAKGTPLKTPDRNETPSSARKLLLGSIERSLHKMRHALTPKKPLDSINNSPIMLNNKNLCNVSTTQCKDPELVITELSRGLEKKGINCTRKGFTLKGSFEPAVFHRLGGCSFELEICFLPNLGLPDCLTPTKSILKHSILNKESIESNGFVGIRRKRLKGDSWCYKKVCEQVLALTCTGFINNNSKESVLESSV